VSVKIHALRSRFTLALHVHVALPYKWNTGLNRTLYFNSEPYFHKYEKLQNVVIHAKIYTEKTLLFMFQPFMLKQFKSLTAIDTFSSFGGLVVTHQTVRDVPGSIHGYGKAFYLWCFVCCCCCCCCCVVTYACPTHCIVMMFCNSLCNVNSCSIFNILQHFIQYTDLASLIKMIQKSLFQC